MVGIMNPSVKESLTQHWPRKLIAIVVAVVVWLLVNNSITTSRTLINVPIRIINVPQDHTIVGLLPSGILSKRINLTLTGSKKVIDDLEPGDIEVISDVSDKSGQWTAEISRKNVVYVSSKETLGPHLTKIAHSPLILEMSRLISARVSVRITPPQGEPPQGYQYLNVWPRWLLHNVKGPEQEVEDLQAQGLQLTFDLHEISKEELDRLEPSNPKLAADEVNYLVPDKWKRVAIPFHNNALEEINDEDAKKLRIEFLRKDTLALDRQLAIEVFYPPRFADEIIPAQVSLQEGGPISKKSGLAVLQTPLFMKNASRLFLDVVRDNLQLVIIAEPESVTPLLRWSVQVVDPDRLEDNYVELLAPVSSAETEPSAPGQHPATHLRERFREYLRRFQLVKSDGSPLRLTAKLNNNAITVEER